LCDNSPLLTNLDSGFASTNPETRAVAHPDERKQPRFQRHCPSELPLGDRVKSIACREALTARPRGASVGHQRQQPGVTELVYVARKNGTGFGRSHRNGSAELDVP